MSKQINIDVLSPRSVATAISEIEKYKKKLIKNTRLFAKRLAESGVEYARVQVETMGAVDTEELKNSIKASGKMFLNGATFYVVASSKHAVFVEFGTGYKGRDVGYKGVFPQGLGWKYVSGKQITDNATRGIYGWFYKGNDGEIHFTSGMESRPFMLNTSVELRNTVEKIAKEVFINGQ